MILKDVLAVINDSVCVYPSGQLRDAKCLLMECYAGNIEKAERSFNKLLQMRNKNELPSKEGYLVKVPDQFFFKTAYLLNSNVTSFESLLNMKVSEIRSYHARGGLFGHIEIFVEEIYVVKKDGVSVLR